MIPVSPFSFCLIIAFGKDMTSSPALFVFRSLRQLVKLVRDVTTDPFVIRLLERNNSLTEVKIFVHLFTSKLSPLQNI